MLRREFDQVVAEYFDMEDKETRKVLLSIDEKDQNSVVSGVASKLYDSIINKIDDIDCETITKSEGDITAIENYEKIVECLGTMDALVKAAGQSTDAIEIIVTAMNNIKSRKDLFEKAFKYEIELPMVTYTMLTYACVAATSFMISCSVEFIKNPKTETFDITIDKIGKFHTDGNLMFKNLKKFNESCSKGEFDKSMNYIIGQKAKNFLGLTAGASVALGVVAGVAIGGLILAIIPLIRELIFTFYLTRVKVSDYFAIQADLLDMNAANVEMNTTIDKTKRKEIAKRQAKIATNFRKFSNAVEVKLKDANSKAIAELKTSDKKIKISDVVDKMPDSASSDDSGSSLF